MVEFEIIGKPCVQKRTRFSKKGGVYNPCKHEELMLEWQMKPYAPQQPWGGPIDMSFTFYLPIPSKTSAIRRRQMLAGYILPIIRPDFDNMAYILTNAMKNVFYKDDSQVVRCLITKLYGDEPKTIVRIRHIEQLCPVGVGGEKEYEETS